MCLFSPGSALGAEESVLLIPHVPTFAPGRPTAVIADKIKHIHVQKESKYPLLPNITILPLCSQYLELFQPLAMQAEAWQAIHGVSEWVMAPIRRGYTLQFTQRPLHRASTVCSPPQCAVRMLKSTVRLLQSLLPRTQKRQRPVTYSRSQTPESRPGKKVIEEDHLEADPLANMPRGLVHVAGSKRRLLSYPGSLSSQMILEIRFRGGGVSIQGSSVCTVPGSSHYYAMHGCGSLPSVTDGNSHSGPVRGSFNIAQDPPPQPLKLPRAQDQLCLEHTVTQPMSIVPGHSYRLQMTATVSVERVTTQLPSRKEPPIPSKLSRK